MKAYIGILLLITVFLSSCGIFFENDISDLELELLSPGDTVYSESVNFLWEQEDEAYEYRFILAEPSFDNLEQILVDTLTANNGYSMQLPIGEYEYKVRAENAGFESAYFSKKFVVRRDDDLEGQIVQLEFPNAGHVFKADTTDLELRWAKLNAADNYVIDVYFIGEDGESQLSVAPVNSDSITTTKVYLDVSGVQRDYYWRVRAENDFSLTEWSTIRSFTVDTTGIYLNK